MGCRGPYGRGWPVAEAVGKDVLVIAGGLGLAPLRPVIYQILSQRQNYGAVHLLYGARSPQDILYADELRRWAEANVSVITPVDSADEDWKGDVGVVTRLLSQAHFEPTRAVAMVCGPEIMMRFAVRELQTQRVPDSEIYLSVERNMKCAIGWCGHCQFGPKFVCRDGPVFSYSMLRPFWAQREI